MGLHNIRRAMMPHPPTVVIENCHAAGRWRALPDQARVGEDTAVEADIFKDGHDVVSAVLKWRKKGEARWHETPMSPIPNGNDRWRGTCSRLRECDLRIHGRGVGRHLPHLAARVRGEVQRRAQPDLKSETLEGAQFVEKAARARGGARAEGRRGAAARARRRDPREQRRRGE